MEGMVREVRWPTNLVSFVRHSDRTVTHRSGATQCEDEYDVVVDDDGEDLGEASYLPPDFVAYSALSQYCPCRFGLAQSFLPLSLPPVAVYRSIDAVAG